MTVHAAAVACDGRAVLIVGDSGSGKSTTAVACAAAGFGFLGDDQVAVSDSDGRSVAHSLFASARLDDIVQRVGPAVPHAVHPAPNGAGKSLVLLSGPGSAVVPSATVAAVIVASVSPRSDSTLVRASAKDALRAMLPSTMLGVVDDRPTVFRACARIVLGLRAYRLHSGRDLHAVPRLVAQALAESR